MNSKVKIGSKVIDIDEFKKEYTGSCRKQDLDVLRDFKSIVNNMRTIKSSADYAAYESGEFTPRNRAMLNRSLVGFESICAVIKRVTKDEGFKFFSRFADRGRDLEQDIETALGIITKMEKGLDLEKSSAVAKANKDGDLEPTAEFMHMAENTDFSTYIDAVPVMGSPIYKGHLKSGVHEIVENVANPKNSSRVREITQEVLKTVSRRGIANFSDDIPELHAVAQMVGIAENGKILVNGEIFELSEVQREKILTYAAAAVSLDQEKNQKESTAESSVKIGDMDNLFDNSEGKGKSKGRVKE